MSFFISEQNTLVNMKDKEKRLRESAIKSDKLVEQLEKALAESMIEVAHLKEVSIYLPPSLHLSVYMCVYNTYGVGGEEVGCLITV